MNPNKALWEKGNLTENAVLMRQSGEALVATSLGVTPQLVGFGPRLRRRYYGGSCPYFRGGGGWNRHRQEPR